jgi:hydroxyacylglutathione hydrolase
MLEDDFTDVMRKALAGHGLNTADAAALAGIAGGAVLSFLRGGFSAETARRLASVLGLNAEACAAHPAHQPAPQAMRQIHQLELPFGGGHVNAWIIEAGDQRILIDAGHNPADLIRALDHCCGRLPDRAFITHAHRDHIGGIGRLLDAGVPVHASGIGGTIPMKAGDRVFCGPLLVTACDLSGHFSPALGFVIDGLPAPTAATGDALFAGSIGGCQGPAAYQQALSTLRAALAPLPDPTVLLPGHGPATTLGEERRGNPFL